MRFLQACISIRLFGFRAHINVRDTTLATNFVQWQLSGTRMNLALCLVNTEAPVIFPIQRDHLDFVQGAPKNSIVSDIISYHVLSNWGRVPTLYPQLKVRCFNCGKLQQLCRDRSFSPLRLRSNHPVSGN